MSHRITSHLLVSASRNAFAHPSTLRPTVLAFQIKQQNLLTYLSLHQRRNLAVSKSSLKDEEGRYKKSYHIKGESSQLDDKNKDDSVVRKNKKRQSIGAGCRVTMKTRNHVLHTDIPTSMGGTDSAPQPVETLLAALIGCTQATALFVARQMKPRRIVIETMEFDVTAYRDDRGALHLPIEENPPVPARLQEITGTVRVVTKQDLTSEQLHILKEQTELRCPVANMMIGSGCVMNVDWISESYDKTA